MDPSNARRLAETLPSEALVVDVGGGAAPFPRADWVVDAISYDEQGSLRNPLPDYEQRFSRERWIRWDICSREPWPIPDKKFDFVVCSHTLEDIRDPIWVCHELQRIAKAGYIETPSRILEQTAGVESPRWPGYYHHRWLVEQEGNSLVFRHKTSLGHVRSSTVALLKPGQTISPKYSIMAFEWSGTFEAREVFEPAKKTVAAELARFAESTRSIPDLITTQRHSPLSAVKHLYWHWLKRLGYLL